MVVKRDIIVPGLEEISSDDDSDDDIQFLDESSRKIQQYETISIDGESMSEGDDDDLVIMSIEDKRKHINQVWRNIIECDLLDQSIQKLGLAKFRVNRDVESYDLPSYKVRKRKRTTQFCQFRNKRGRVRIKSPRKEIIHISSSSDDESESHCERKIRTRKNEPIIIDDDDDDEKSPAEIHDLISDSDDSDSGDEAAINTWTKLIKNIDENQMQIEFESGREAAARKIAKELQESKIDLIDRCLIYLGLERCQTFLAATKRIEENGGMPTKDGSRRRTPGGVFLTLIKSDRTIERSIKEQIFLDSEEDANNENESLWWKSVEVNQYRRNFNTNRCSGGSAHLRRRKEFKSYTLIDLDYFECFKDFRYRYIPMVSSFPLLDGGGGNSSTSSQLGDDNDDDEAAAAVDDDLVVVTSSSPTRRADTDTAPLDEFSDEHFQMDIYEIGDV